MNLDLSRRVADLFTDAAPIAPARVTESPAPQAATYLDVRAKCWEAADARELEDSSREDAAIIKAIDQIVNSTTELAVVPPDASPATHEKLLTQAEWIAVERLA